MPQYSSLAYHPHDPSPNDALPLLMPAPGEPAGASAADCISSQIHGDDPSSPLVSSTTTSPTFSGGVNRTSAFYRVLSAAYLSPQSTPVPPIRKSSPDPAIEETLTSLAWSESAFQADYSDDEGEVTPAMPRGFWPSVLPCSIYRPHGNWAWADGLPMTDVHREVKLPDGIMCSASIKSAKLGDREIKYICKSWAAQEKWEGFFSELALYKCQLKPLQGEVVPTIISLYTDTNAINVAMEPPHQSFWIEASADMPHVLKKRCVTAFERIHAQGVLHGDVELRHMLIGGDAKVTIIDFQASRALIPNEKVELKAASPAELRKEMRKVKFKLRYEESRTLEDQKMVRSFNRDRRNRNEVSRARTQREHRAIFGDVVEGDRVDPPIDSREWNDSWIYPGDVTPTRFVMPGQTSAELELEVQHFLAIVEGMVKAESAVQLTPPSTPPSTPLPVTAETLRHNSRHSLRTRSVVSSVVGQPLAGMSSIPVADSNPYQLRKRKETPLLTLGGHPAKRARRDTRPSEVTTRTKPHNPSSSPKRKILTKGKQTSPLRVTPSRSLWTPTNQGTPIQQPTSLRSIEDRPLLSSYHPSPYGGVSVPYSSNDMPILHRRASGFDQQRHPARLTLPSLSESSGPSAGIPLSADLRFPPIKIRDFAYEIPVYRKRSVTFNARRCYDLGVPSSSTSIKAKPRRTDAGIQEHIRRENSLVLAAKKDLRFKPVAQKGSLKRRPEGITDSDRPREWATKKVTEHQLIRATKEMSNGKRKHDDEDGWDVYLTTHGYTNLRTVPGIPEWTKLEHSKIVNPRASSPSEIGSLLKKPRLATKEQGIVGISGPHSSRARAAKLDSAAGSPIDLDDEVNDRGGMTFDFDGKDSSLICSSSRASQSYVTSELTLGREELDPCSSRLGLMTEATSVANHAPVDTLPTPGRLSGRRHKKTAHGRKTTFNPLKHGSTLPPPQALPSLLVGDSLHGEHDMTGVLQPITQLSISHSIRGWIGELMRLFR